ncbi:O-antigen ligase family protein [Pantanalinema rosaneae CENA516]|uniref:O-antigen ligase family protein n=1 Tax=Pantanalinema rosaneae TaxID=1620701 RepID=UPI003D6E7F3C
MYLIIFILAFVIAIIYYWIAYRYTNKQEHKYSLKKIFLVILLFSMIDIYLFPFSKIHPSTLTGFDKTSLSSGLQITVYIAIFLTLNWYFKNFLKNSVLLFRDPFLIILLVFTMLSTFWSETPILTFRSSLVIIGFTTLGSHIAKQYSWQELNYGLRWSQAWIVGIGLIVAVIFPSIGFEPKGLKGIMPFANWLGTLTALGTVLWILQAISYSYKRKLSLSMASLMFLVTFAAGSGTGILLLLNLVMFMFFLLMLRKFGFRWKLVLTPAFIIFAILGVVFISQNFAFITESFGKDSTLTGRTDFWPQLIHKISQHSLTGYGYYGFWQPWRGIENPAIEIGSASYTPPRAHNGFIQIGLDLGLTGLLLFGSSLIRSVILLLRYIQVGRKPDSIAPLIILLFIVLSNVSQDFLFTPNYRWFYYILIIVAIDIEIRNTVLHSSSILKTKAH